MSSVCELAFPCTNLNDNLEFFTSKLGFRVAQISPADDPTMAVVQRSGCAIRLEQGKFNLESATAVTLRIRCEDEELALGVEEVAPNGLRVLRVPVNPPMVLPKPIQSLIVTRAAPVDDAVAGRAGMMYTDLIPGRMGGAFIASHIAIPDGGPVNDYVHFHKIRFQLIYVKAGWVKVVYEDQGDPFIMYPGDCVMQPPQIRHRVLESSPGLEVIEIGAPAVHDTFGELEMELPNGVGKEGRLWEQQKFHFHSKSKAVVGEDGVRDLGMKAASNGVFSLKVHTFQKKHEWTVSHSEELMFFYILEGSLSFAERDEGTWTNLKAGDSCVLPATDSFQIVAETGTEVLECQVFGHRE